MLKKSVDAIEEAVGVCRRLNVPADLANSLNHASIRYSDLAGAAENVEERRALLKKAVDAIEEAVRIRHQLSLPANFANSLNNASGCYSDLASGLYNASLRYSDLAQAVQNVEERRALLKKAVDAIEEAVGLYRTLNLPADLATSLHNASGCYSDLAGAAENVEERRALLEKAVDAIEEAVRILRQLNLPADLASSLYNASSRYSDLAEAAQSSEEWRDMLKKAVDAIEDAVRIIRQLNLPAELATSLYNASGCYSALVGATESVEEGRALLKKAVDAIEDAVRIRRQLNLPADLASSLYKASIRYSDLAGVAENVEERRDRLQQAVDAIEEAVRIIRQLNLPAELASSLNNASNCYSDLAGAAENAEERRTLFKKAVDAIEEAVRIRLWLNLPADLANSLKNASKRYSDLAQAAQSVEEGRALLEKAVDAFEDAVDLYRLLKLPADLAESLETATNVFQVRARFEEDEVKAREFQVRAATSIDEAIGLFERTDRWVSLIQAYPHGVRVHLPLMGKRAESVAKVKEYAAKAAPLLRAYKREEEAAKMEQLAQQLGQQTGVEELLRQLAELEAGGSGSDGD